MPDTYRPTYTRALALHLERDRVSRVPLRGIPTIPAEADRLWRLGLEELPEHLQAECDRQIAAAMAEHKLRREAKLQGVTLLPDDEEIE